MTEWFTEEYKSRTTTKRRKLNVEQERQEVHSKIKSFFQQFKKGDNFDIVRQKLSRSHSRSTDKSSMDVESGSGFYFSGSGRDSGKLSSADKACIYSNVALHLNTYAFASCSWSF
jgi:hypothetical protein